MATSLTNLDKQSHITPEHPNTFSNKRLTKYLFMILLVLQIKFLYVFRTNLSSVKYKTWYSPMLNVY